MANTGNFCFLLPTREEAEILVVRWTAFLEQSSGIKNLEISVVGVVGPTVVVGSCDRLLPEHVYTFLARLPKLKPIALVVNSIYGDRWELIPSEGLK